VIPVCIVRSLWQYNIAVNLQVLVYLIWDMEVWWSVEVKWPNWCRFTFAFVPFWFWEPYFKHRWNLDAKSLVLPPQSRPNCHEIVIHAWQSIYRKQLPFYFTFTWITGILCDCKLWSELFRVTKSEMQLVVVSAECKMAFRRRHCDENIVQELILDWLWCPLIWRWRFSPKWQWH
jgi:hypothetical protein